MSSYFPSDHILESDVIKLTGDLRGIEKRHNTLEHLTYKLLLAPSLAHPYFSITGLDSAIPVLDMIPDIHLHGTSLLHPGYVAPDDVNALVTCFETSNQSVDNNIRRVGLGHSRSGEDVLLVLTDEGVRRGYIPDQFVISDYMKLALNRPGSEYSHLGTLMLHMWVAEASLKVSVKGHNVWDWLVIALKDNPFLEPIQGAGSEGPRTLAHSIAHKCQHQFDYQWLRKQLVENDFIICERKLVAPVDVPMTKQILDWMDNCTLSGSISTFLGDVMQSISTDEFHRLNWRIISRIMDAFNHGERLNSESLPDF